MSSELLSIITPMYNESAGVDRFFDAITRALARIDINYEIVCVDDGSSDDTLARLRRHAERDPHIRVLALTRNFGKEAAMTAALDHASGDAVLPMDADLQDPPELIGDMLAQWRTGEYEVVYARRASRRSDSLTKRKTAQWFYRLFNRMSEVQIPENVGDFRLMDRRAVEAIKQLPEKDRFMKGLFCWPGFRHTVIEFDRNPRREGYTKFNYWRLWNFALSGITSFSTFPIRVGTYLGLFVSLCAFLFAVIIVIKTLTTGVDVPGYASTMVVILFLGGIQLFFLGLLGEYVGRIYKEVKNRPIYLVADKWGFDEPDTD